MKFIVELPTNANEVNLANQKNAEIKGYNEVEEKKPLKNQKLKELVEVPKLDLIEKPLLVDAAKITLAHINQNGDIQFNYEGQVYKAKYDDQVWQQLEERFN
jgi:hypothetical protein